MVFLCADPEHWSGEYISEAPTPDAEMPFQSVWAGEVFLVFGGFGVLLRFFLLFVMFLQILIGFYDFLTCFYSFS